MTEEWGNITNYEVAPVRGIMMEQLTGLGRPTEAMTVLSSRPLTLAPGRLTPPGRLILLIALFSLSLAAIGQLLEAGGFVPAFQPALTRQRVEAAVTGYLDAWDPLTDPLIILENGMQVKSSNIKGVEIDGRRYYYRTGFGFSGDPVSRGETVDYQIFMVLDAGSHFETEVYQLTR